MSKENENDNYDYLSIPMDVKEKLINNIKPKEQIEDNNNNSISEEDSLSNSEADNHHHDLDQNDAMKKLFYVSIVCLIFMIRL